MLMKMQYPKFDHSSYQVLGSSRPELFSKARRVVLDRGSSHAPHAYDFGELESTPLPMKANLSASHQWSAGLSGPDRDAGARELMLGGNSEGALLCRSLACVEFLGVCAGRIQEGQRAVRPHRFQRTTCRRCNLERRHCRLYIASVDEE